MVQSERSVYINRQLKSSVGKIGLVQGERAGRYMEAVFYIKYYAK